MSLQKKHINAKGFTIIELIVVVAIIALLGSIVSINATTYIRKAKRTRANVEAKNIGDAINLFNIQYNSYPYNAYYDCWPEYGYCYAQIVSGQGTPQDDSGHLLSEFYKLDWTNSFNAKYFLPTAYYDVWLWDDGTGNGINCGVVDLVDDNYNFYGEESILNKPCSWNCEWGTCPFSTSTYW